MARIRTIKPEFPQSESMGNVSRDARLTFIQLWTLADDEGRLRGNSRMLASLLFPYDDDAATLIDGWLCELERERCVVRYKADGQSYLQIDSWLMHQKIDKPSKSKIPAPDDSSRKLANPLEQSSGDQGSKDQGSKDQGVDPRDAEAPPPPPAAPPAPAPPPEPAPKKAPAEKSTAAKPDDVTDQTWADWLALRKAKKAPPTETVVKHAQDEAAKAGISLEAFLQIWCARGSQGLQADWLKPQELAAGKPRRMPAADNFAEKDYGNLEAL